MQLSCSRYIFTYQSPANEVEDFIKRSDDLASIIYGRDKQFSRLNQIIDQARFLGWPLPRFGPELPEELTDIPPEGVNHIFENQSKILVDIAPITRVMLDDGKYCPVRMICASTAAGDLIWKCHLLTDVDGNPYVQFKDKKYKVKTKGTKIACQTETLPYDEKYLFECFGGEQNGIWPVPFLPEFFSDRAIAQKFSPEAGVVEVVYIDEKNPVHVIAMEMVPWYRMLEIDRTKALGHDEWSSPSSTDNTSTAEEVYQPVEADNLVEGWDDVPDNETFDLEEEYEDDGEELVTLINVITSFSDDEFKKLEEYEKILSECNITSKQEAEDLRKDPEHKERAEKWLVAAVNRLRLISNYGTKFGALISLVQRHQGQQILIIQPRQKWASKLVQILKQREIPAELLNHKNKEQLSNFYEGEIPVLITHNPIEELFIEDLIIISVSTFNIISWLKWLNPTQVIYTIAIKQFGLSDYNHVPEHPLLDVKTEEYTGPVMDILKLDSQESSVLIKAKTSKAKNLRFKIKYGKGRPKTAASYEKALEIAKKLENDGHKVEIYAPEGKDALYVTGMPKFLQGELK